MDYANILRPLLFRSPLFILLFVGFVLAIIRWKRNGRASLFAIVGFLVLSFSTFFATLFPALLSELSNDFSNNRNLFEFILMSMRVFPFLDAIGWVFILLAIFSGRKLEMKQEASV